MSHQLLDIWWDICYTLGVQVIGNHRKMHMTSFQHWRAGNKNQKQN
jgi:hypothetical protein